MLCLWVFTLVKNGLCRYTFAEFYLKMRYLPLGGNVTSLSQNVEKKGKPTGIFLRSTIDFSFKLKVLNLQENSRYTLHETLFSQYIAF